jgi:hypothetical protein
VALDPKSLRRGELVRIASSNPVFGKEIGVVEVTTSTRVSVHFVRFGRRGAVYGFDVLPIGPDDLSDEECALVMKWKLQHA